VNGCIDLLRVVPEHILRHRAEPELMVIVPAIQPSDFVIGSIVHRGMAQYLQERKVEPFADPAHAGLPAHEGLAGKLQCDAVSPLSKEVKEGVCTINHHEIGPGSQAGFQEFRQIGVPDTIVLHKGDYLGLAVRDGAHCRVRWHKRYIL